jgi:hypothetical protein
MISLLAELIFSGNIPLSDTDALQALKPTGLTTDFQTQYQ